MGATCSSNSLNPNCTNPTIQLNSNPIPNPIPTTNPSLTNSTAIIPNVELIKKIENFTFILLSKQTKLINLSFNSGKYINLLLLQTNILRFLGNLGKLIKLLL